MMLEMQVLLCSLLLASTNSFVIDRNELWNNMSIEIFREYIQIDTSRHEQLDKASQFWHRMAHSIGLPITVYEVVEGYPIIVITWEGTDPSLQSIMLNSHMDVVTAEPELWSYPPFDATVLENGDIYGRGTQDMKCVGIQYLEAIKRLKYQNIKLERTIHMTLMPDEETGGLFGMMKFVDSPQFKALNVGFALDEGVASPDETFGMFYVDKRPWQMNIMCSGEGGHGSGMPDNTAMEKVEIIMSNFIKFRQEQKTILKSKNATDYGSYTTINLTKLKGGIATNIIPHDVNITIDIRLATYVEPDEFLDKINDLLAPAGAGIRYEFIRKIDNSPAVKLDGLFIETLKEGFAEMNMTVIPKVCPATSDMVYVRQKGIPAIGFSPINKTPIKIHDNNEFLNSNIFLRGIEIYMNLIQKLGNVKPS